MTPIPLLFHNTIVNSGDILLFAGIFITVSGYLFMGVAAAPVPFPPLELIAMIAFFSLLFSVPPILFPTIKMIYELVILAALGLGPLSLAYYMTDVNTKL